MSQVKRTIYSNHLATCMMLRRPFTILPNSTLNQKFNLHRDEVPAINEYPVLGYIAIGNKGVSYETTSDGYVITTPKPRLPRFASLYNFIPFVLRDINDDISATERMKYRMRVPVALDGKTYVAYYLRKLTVEDVIPTVELRNVDGETITTTAFEPSFSDLAPVAPELSNTDLNNPNGDYLVSTAKVRFEMNQAEVNSVIEACSIMFGDPRYAVINEVALCTGIDKVLQGTFGGTSSNYTDVIAAQVAAFIQQYHALSATTTKVSLDLDIGSVSPLLV